MSTLTIDRKRALARQSVARKVAAGDDRPVRRFAEGIVARQAGGFLTVLPSEVAAVTFLAGGEGAAEAREELAGMLLAHLGA